MSSVAGEIWVGWISVMPAVLESNCSGRLIIIPITILVMITIIIIDVFSCLYL